MIRSDLCQASDRNEQGLHLYAKREGRKGAVVNLQGGWPISVRLHIGCKKKTGNGGGSYQGVKAPRCMFFCYDWGLLFLFVGTIPLF